MPDSVIFGIRFGEDRLVDLFRDHFGEVDVYYFNSTLVFDNAEDFMTLYASTTYYSETHRDQVERRVKEKITNDRRLCLRKSAMLLVGHDLIA
jgi:hypothetical protein